MNRQQLTEDEKNLKNISNFGVQQQFFHVVNAARQAMHQLSKDFPHDFAGLAVTHGHQVALQPLRQETSSTVRRHRQQAKRPACGWPFLGHRDCARCVRGLRLLEQGQHALLRLVGLGQHGRCRLRDDLRLGQVGGFFGVVGVHDAAA